MSETGEMPLLSEAEDRARHAAKMAKKKAARDKISVRFTGLLREDANTAPEAIDETWHLTKPRSGNSGWLVAGIQQNA